MAASRDLESSFKPQREKHALIYCKKFKAINDTRLVSNHDKDILLAVLAFTANEKLFKMFDRLSVSHLKELAHLSEITFKNLRNFDGRAGDDCSDSSGTDTHRESFSESLARCYRERMEQTYKTARDWRKYSVGYDENIETLR
ncbi:hypothetical protein TWF569_006012 [Orbilia oligospora]|nr:hypothetical protein TWF569_006012 [Orbilia oligospora]